MNLLGSATYDPGTAVDASTASLLAMTALDTTNLRLTVTVPAHGKLRIRLACMTRGGTATPGIFLGCLESTTVRGRMTPLSGATCQGNRNGHVADYILTGLTPGSITLDAAYGVDAVATSNSISYGGPNNTTGADAWGAFVFEIYDPQPLKTALDGGVNVTQFGGTNATTSGGRPEVNVSHWLGTAAATPTVAGVPEVDVTHWLGTAAATPTVAGVPEVDVTHWVGATTVPTNVTTVFNTDFAANYNTTLDAWNVNSTHISGSATAADNVEVVYSTDFATNYDATNDRWTVNVKTWNDLTTVALPLVPTTAGRTLDVSAGGEAGVDWANIGSPTTTVNLSGTTVKTATDVETDTQNIQSRIPTALTANGYINADVSSIDAVIVAAQNLSSSFDDNPGSVPWTNIIDQGTAQSSTGTTLVLRSAAAFADDELNGATIVLTDGTNGIGQRRIITDYVSSTKTATIDPAWTTTPTTPVYKIFGTAPFPTGLPTAVNVTQISGSSTAADNAKTVFATDFATNYDSTNDRWTVNVKTWNDLTTVSLPLVPTTAGRTLDVSAGGEAGLDWANIGSPSSIANLDNTRIKTAIDVEADTDNIQTRIPAALTSGGNIKADALAFSGSTTAADNAEIVFDTDFAANYNTTLDQWAVNVTNIEGVDATNQIRDSVVDDATRIDASALNTLSSHDPGETIMGATDLGTGTGFTAIPWNAAWDAEVQSEVEDGLIALGYTTTVSGRIDATISSRSTVTTAQVNTEVDTALADINLDHLMAVAAVAGDVVNSSIIAQLTSKSATPAFTSYNNTTDSLEAIRDRGDAAWITSTLTAADVWAAATRTLTAGTNIQLPSNGLDNITAWTVNITGSLSGSVGSVTGNVGGNVVGSVGSLTTNNDKTGYRLSATGVDDIFDEAVEASATMRESLRLANSANAGKLSGAATSTILIRDLSDSKNRVSATVDGNGNRTAITLDLT